MTQCRNIPGNVAELHRHLAALDREALEARVRSMAGTGIPEYDVAALTSLSVEQVRRILAGPSLHLSRDTNPNGRGGRP